MGDWIGYHAVEYCFHSVERKLFHLKFFARQGQIEGVFDFHSLYKNTMSILKRYSAND